MQHIVKFTYEQFEFIAYANKHRCFNARSHNHNSITTIIPFIKYVTTCKTRI